MQSAPAPNKSRVVLAVNAAWNVVNFRAGLVRGLIGAGHDVIVVAPDDGHTKAIQSLGATYVPIDLDRKGKNPLTELATLRSFQTILTAIQPQAFLGFTIKPNIYGSIACRRLGIPVINNIAGLGTMFGNRGIANMLARLMYGHALKRSARVFFQNDDDQTLFVNSGLVSEEQCVRVPGSGVDLARFAPVALPCESGVKSAPVRFLLSARLLWDKGIREYFEAARYLRARGFNADFSLLGLFDEGNPGGIARKQIEEWESTGAVRFLGSASDVRIHLKNADCVVLPSYYREGVPRTLLEAASMARPLIATDAVGCRDAIDNDSSGYLVRPQDPIDLAAKMEKFILATIAERVALGKAGRAKMEAQFDEQIVVGRYVDELSRLVRRRG